jgi:hypothetical protein
VYLPRWSCSAVAAADESHAEALADLFSANASLLLPAYEAALRCLATTGAGDAAAAVAAQHASAAANVTRAAIRQMTDADADTLAGSTSGRRQQRQLLRQLYALQVTCRKCGVQDATQLADADEGQAAAVFRAVARVVGTSMAMLDHIAEPAAGAAGSRGGAGHGDSSSSSSDSSSSSIGRRREASSAAAAADAAPWVALLARCFCSWAGLLSQEVSAMEATQWASQPDTAAVPDTYRPFAGVLTSEHALAMMAYVDRFPGYLEMAGLSSDVQQQLQQQVAAASDKVAGLQGAVLLAASRAWPSNERPYAGLAAQQLNSMAQAVAGRIPLSIACNNPGCSNLAQRSELVLVGGKSCVCARCKAARWGTLCCCPDGTALGYMCICV